MSLKRIIEDIDTPAGRAFDAVIQTLIVLSLFGFGLETLPDLSDLERQWLRYFEVFVIGIFTAEYALRFAVADNKLAFATSFYGIIDLLAILPFYLTIGLDLRSLRALRMLRLVRVLKLLRYSEALHRFARALSVAKEELFLFFFVSLLLIYFAAMGIYFFENPVQPERYCSIFESLWWATCTLTTVGYGDMYPVTVGGKLFTVVILLIGLGIVAVPAGIVAAALTEIRERDETDHVQ